MKCHPESKREVRLPPFAIVLCKWFLAVGLLASLLFAHGCHGPDEDHELFAIVAAMIGR